MTRLRELGLVSSEGSDSALYVTYTTDTDTTCKLLDLNVKQEYRPPFFSIRVYLNLTHGLSGHEWQIEYPDPVRLALGKDAGELSQSAGRAELNDQSVARVSEMLLAVAGAIVAAVCEREGITDSVLAAEDVPPGVLDLLENQKRKQPWWKFFIRW